ncbi:hypothetical protein M0R45_000810 [Rubus argutus]|uniref:rhamnogalacturonan endolyase n=1 Tax=Rubus argutus TaxID=59490 RepID=A0AAW1VJX9_RUBAR
MEKMRQWGWLLGSLAAMLFLVLFFVGDGNYDETTSPVRRSLRSIIPWQQQGVNLLTRTPKRVVLDNGIVKVVFSVPGGDVIGIQYKGLDILEMRNEESNRGYWDVVWSPRSIYDKIQGTKFKIITAKPDQAEISFVKTYDVSFGNSTVPFNVDKRYILQRGGSGFYAYAIFERLEGWPEAEVDQIRIVYKLQQAKFQYMALSDTRQRIMPRASDRDHGVKLAYPEAVLLTNPSNPDLRGEVDDKYQYSIENKDNKVHGWICTDQSVGFWMITPSDEFRTCGPIKQDLTSHVGPTTLSMFVSTHYAGKQVGIKFGEGEAWKKVFGPVFVYLNSAPSSTNNSISTLWNDAKQQMLEEVESWPYNFTQSEDFPSSDQRGSVSGQLLIHDRYINESLFSASSAYVGLAAPGEVGSWQTENKGYQFWNQADDEGRFIIKDVRPGNYSLYAWVPGIVGDYKYEADITITPGCDIELDNLTYEPPRNGPTLWEIGIPDRTAAEFHVPDPYPTLLNKLYRNHSENFRQYGLWARYEERYPHRDLVYTVGVDDYHDDWFYAQVTRNTGNETYVGTTWQIVFDLNNVTSPGNYTLQLALASANSAELQVRINNQSDEQPHFSTKLIGGDNAIARHGIHGLYWLFSVDIPSPLLKEGNNTIYLAQTRGGQTFQGVMYDYIRLEAPSSTPVVT